MHVGGCVTLTGVQDCVAPIVGTFRWPGYDDSIAYPRKKWNGCPDRVGFCRTLRARDAGSPARPPAGRAGRGESALALEPPCRCRAKSVYGYL